MGATATPRKAAATRIKSPARTTPRGLRWPSSWRGWRRSFRWSARTAAAIFGSEKTAGRSRPTSNRRFASGRRPGWLRPREVRSSHTSASHSSLRPSLPPVVRRPTGESSCRSTTGQSFRRRPTSSPTSTSTASDGIPCHGADGPQEERFQDRSAPTTQIRPWARIGRSSEPPRSGRIQPDRSRLLLLMIRPARLTLAEVPMADLSLGTSAVRHTLHGRQPARRHRR
jgi:hypothetical protein